MDVEAVAVFAVFGEVTANGTVVQFDAFVLSEVDTDLFGTILSCNQFCNSLSDGIHHFACCFVFLLCFTALPCLSVTVCSVDGVLPDFTADGEGVATDGSYDLAE